MKPLLLDPQRRHLPQLDECETTAVSWRIRGQAQGGTLSALISGFSEDCTVSIETMPGESIESISSRFAAAINSDSCAQGQGITASSAGAAVTVTGLNLNESDIETDVSDPGLEHLLGLPHKLFFAQFADGEGLSSQMTLFNASTTAANILILVKDDQGLPLSVDLNGEEIPGQLNAVLAAGGLAVFETDGLGDLRVGSVSICSDQPLAGVLLFNSPSGLAGVTSSAEQEAGFQTLIETNALNGISTGIAIQNLESEDNFLELELRALDGEVLAVTELELPPMGHRARFIEEFTWTPLVDFSEFRGSLRVISSGRVAATALQVRPGQFAAIPVIPLEP